MTATPTDPEKADALAKLADLVTRIVEGDAKAAEVIRLPRTERASRPGPRPSARSQPRSIQRHAR